MHTFISNL